MPIPPMIDELSDRDSERYDPVFFFFFGVSERYVLPPLARSQIAEQQLRVSDGWHARLKEKKK